MHIYFSGIGGAGLSALAHLTLDTGYTATGSDREENENIAKLRKRGIHAHIGQSGSEIKAAHAERAVDWLVITSALPEDHPEIKFAKENNIQISKRDELLNRIIKENDLSLLAISGTHGKTTVTGMIVWIFKRLKIPVSYSIGTNISFGRSAEHDQNARWFVYEADEFDRNMLRFKPNVAIIPALDYDHSDTYDSPSDYIGAFKQFVAQSNALYTWKSVANKLKPLPLNPLFTWSDGAERASEARLFFEEGKIFDDVIEPIAPNLIGEVNRRNGLLAAETLYDTLGTSELDDEEDVLWDKIYNALESFPGTERRLEPIAQSVLSDYAHHPEEIKAVISAIRDYMSRKDGNDLIVVYQPHQNIRQHEIKEQYKDCFRGVDKLYWLPTYLSRENPNLKVLTPEHLTSYLSNEINYKKANLNKKLIQEIRTHQEKNDLILLLGAGSIDPYFRDYFN